MHNQKIKLLFFLTNCSFTLIFGWIEIHFVSSVLPFLVTFVFMAFFLCIWKEIGWLTAENHFCYLSLLIDTALVKNCRNPENPISMPVFGPMWLWDE